MNKDDLLLAAINDIQESIRFLDTKVAFLMGLQGFLFTALVSHSKNIYNIYSKLNSSKIIIYVFLLVILLYLISTALTFLFSFKCILPKKLKVKNHNIWFIDQDITFDEYQCKITEFKEEQTTELLGRELYVVNKISFLKCKEVKYAFNSFAVSCTCLLIISFYILLFYL